MWRREWGALCLQCWLAGGAAGAAAAHAPPHPPTMAGDAPTAVLTAALSRFTDGDADFAPARAFAGRRPGAYFGTGPRGTG